MVQALIDGVDGKRTNAQLLKLVADLTGDLSKEKKTIEEVEYSFDDISRDAENIISYLREKSKEVGVCPLCLNAGVLSEEVCLHQVD
jgi:hypothetical protein